ncbi:MAG TPA: translocation/assembly module TamB domain-containing protein, partial [Candidatus Acidoferrales bacterium]|nr:translocation/assembly module TamB domain-containing protein [Candidatus Acidoferrales bacterium]
FKAPTFLAGIDASNVRAYGIPVDALFGEVRLQGTDLVLSNAGATIGKGDITLAGSLPLQLSPLRLGPQHRTMSFDVDVTGLDPAIFDQAFGNDTKLGGTISAHLGVGGSVGAPVVIGRATLANGSYVSTLERKPITHAAAELAFDRTTATLSGVSARLGDGSLHGSGRIEFPGGFESLSGYSFVSTMVAKGAQLDLPAYGTGTLDADLAMTKTPGTHALLSGTVALSNASLPFSAFVNAAQQASGGAGPQLPPVAFDLTATAGKNVRVRGSGYGAGLDIGVSGSVSLAGTLEKPTLAGQFNSTGGTLTYFDRAFRVQEGSVVFDPASGLLPAIHAVATTSVVNPDPDRARNPYGTADITIDVNGPIENLNIAFTSNPAGYTRDQIIAMIAPLGGFIGGIAFTNQSVYQVQSPSGITPLGNVSPLPNLYTQRYSTITVGQEAFNILNAQFAAGLLSPVENAIGQGLGLSNVNLTLGYYGNVGVTATRLLGKAVSAVFATTFGIPQIQSFGLKVQPNAYTSATLSFFYQTGPLQLFQTPNAPIGFSGELYGQPLLGQNGFSVTLKHYLGAAGVP